MSATTAALVALWLSLSFNVYVLHINWRIRRVLRDALAERRRLVELHPAPSASALLIQEGARRGPRR